MEEVFNVPNIAVVKIGSSTLVDEHGTVDRSFIAHLCNQVAELQKRGYGVVIVSSGAVAAGMERLQLKRRPDDIPGLQACAAAGQAALTEVYADVLAKHGVPCGQVLLTRRDLTDREAYLNARNTLGRLLGLGAVPVVNENDTVSIAEITFGDNDTLGAIVATLVNADLYVILSDVDGLYSANPQVDRTAQLITRVEEITSEISAMAGGAGSHIGTGGMATKIRAARATMAAGIPTIICRGRRENSLLMAVAGDGPHTRFEPAQNSSHESARKLWIGLAELPRGTVYVDEGAVEAVMTRGASILPVGIVRSEGSFDDGDVVNVVAPDASLIGRGICRYSSEDMSRIHGLKLDVIARFMPHKEGVPAIHRDELLLF